MGSRRGRGYASEAIRARSEFALTGPRVHTVPAAVESSNPASIRVLEKAGFQRWATEGAWPGTGSRAPTTFGADPWALEARPPGPSPQSRACWAGAEEKTPPRDGRSD